jgi:hypothetical protein
MSSNSAANESDTSVTKVEQKQTAATIPRIKLKSWQNQQDSGQCLEKAQILSKSAMGSTNGSLILLFGIVSRGKLQSLLTQILDRLLYIL